GDLVRTIIVDSTVICRMKRENIIDNSKISAGDVIVGLSSSGKADYEDSYNGGMGSNGFTSARHDVFLKLYAKKYPESFDSSIPAELVYSGSRKLTDAIGSTGMNAGKLLLSPTRTYAPVIKKVLDKFRNEIHGMVHCSGGGQTKALNFVNDLHIIKDGMFDVPLLFRLIQEESKTPWKEMYKVFNMGHRFEIYIEKNITKEIIGISKSFGVDAKIIGHCEKNKGLACPAYRTGRRQAGKKLTVISEFGKFEY
ncbi:MAG: AIR synthase-related protein, partial [Bacteroidota bacterium]